MTLRTLLGKLASVTVLRLGVAASGFALFWLLSHHLSSAALGGFSVLMNTFFLLQAMPLLGLGVHLIREVAAHPAQQPHDISVATALALPVSGLLCLGLIGHGLWIAHDDLRPSFMLLGLSMWPTAWVLVAESALIGREQLKVLTWVNLLESLWRMLGAGVAVWQGWGLTGVFAFFLSGRVLAAVAYGWGAGLPRPRLALVSLKAWQHWVTLAPTYFAIALVSAACSRIDMIVLSQLRSLQDVGVYAAGAKLYEASLMVSTMALMIVFPVLSRLFATDRAAFATLLARCMRWGLLLGVPAVLVGMALAPTVVQWLYAPSLWGAAPVLQALLLAAWLMALDQLLSATMLAAQAQSHDLRAMAVGLLTLLTLLVGLGLWLGPLGAAWAVVAGLALRVLWRLRWAEADLAVAGLRKQALRAAVAAGAGVAMFWWLQPLPTVDHARSTASLIGHTLLALGVGLASHALVAVLVGAFGAEHRADWSSWRRKAPQPEALA